MQYNLCNGTHLHGILCIVSVLPLTEGYHPWLPEPQALIAKATASQATVFYTPSNSGQVWNAASQIVVSQNLPHRTSPTMPTAFVRSK